MAGQLRAWHAAGAAGARSGHASGPRVLTFLLDRAEEGGVRARGPLPPALQKYFSLIAEVMLLQHVTST